MSEITIIENTREAKNNYGHGYGSGDIGLTDEMLRALKNGKILAFNDGEYTHFLYYEKK